MGISSHQVQAIQQAHQEGKLDPAIAQQAGVSLATVKRYRSGLGLETNCVTAQRGQLGEQVMAEQAAARGLKVVWRPCHNDKHDLMIEGQRVDVKAAMKLADGSWRFRLPSERKSFFNRHVYPKHYASDCEVVALVALHPDASPPNVYLLASSALREDIRIRPGGAYDAIRDDWSALEIVGAPLRA